MGIHVNTFLAANLAHQLGSKINIYLEDDIIVSTDVLRLVDQFIVSQKPGMLCLRRWHKTQETNNPNLVQPALHGLLGNGFAWESKYWTNNIRPWWFVIDSKCGGFMWDWSVSYGLDLQGIQQWRPMINRSQNIGIHGTHNNAGTDLNHFGELYTGPTVEHFEFV